MIDLPPDQEYNARVHQIAEVLRTHQYDEGTDGRYSGRCFCGNQMGDQENHQAMALIQDGLVPLHQPPIEAAVSA
jgi:hypothetical protein